MPTYDFINTTTNEITEEYMSISDCQKYLQDNPHIKIYHGKGLTFMDEYTSGRKKPNGQWFDLLDKIKKTTPHNKMNETRFSRSREW